MRKLLYAFGFFGLFAIIWLALLDAFAQPASSTRLRDLNDVRISTTPANGAALVWDSALKRWKDGTASGGSGGTVGLADFNSDQFRTNGGTVSIKGGALMTNAVLVSPKTGNLLPTSSNPLYPLMVESPDGSGGNRDVSVSLSFWMVSTNGYFEGPIYISGQTNRALSIVNDQLYLNGVPVTGTSEATPILQQWISNFFAIKGSHNQVVITQTLQFAWSTLTLSGSNVPAPNLTNSTLFKLTLTTNGFLPAPVSFPGTNFGQTYQIHIAQDGSGGRSLMVTNGGWNISGYGTSTNPILALNTNANAITVLTFATSPFNSTTAYGIVTPF